MSLDISKHCATALRTFAKEEHNIKLKSAHAHELVAAFFGYKTKVSLLADEKYPINNLGQADFVVLPPDSFVDKRRNKLEGLDSNLPGNDVLGDVVYQSLYQLCEEVWECTNAPFRSYEKLAKDLVENDLTYQSINHISINIPRYHYVTFEDDADKLILNVFHAYKKGNGEMEVGGKAIICLPRVAGRIGFGDPGKIHIEQWTSGFRRSLESLGIQP